MLRSLHFFALVCCLVFINHFVAEPSTENDDQHCSAICLKNNGYAVFGANMDWADSDAGLIYINPRGLHKTGWLRSTTGRTAEWTARYASITFNLVAYQLPWGGMNEKGICFSTMSGLGWTTMESADERPPLDSGHWFQYVLDTCATIDEVIAATEEMRLVTVDHYLITDRYGDRAVLEFINGRRVVHRGDSLPVAASANSPYSDCLQYWEFKKQNGYVSAPDTSVLRFVTAAERVDAFHETSIENAVGYAFETLHRVRGEQYTQHTSQWSIVFDTRNMRTWFRTARHRTIRYLDLYDFDLDCNAPVKMLDVQSDLTKWVSDDFKDFDYGDSFELYRNFCRDWGINASENDLHSIMSLFEGYQCTTEKPKEEISVSMGIDGLNINPRCAVNPANGDVLAVWEQHEANDKSVKTIRSAMLKRSLTGRYQIADSGTLSSYTGYNANPFPLYDATNKRYLVVWDQANPDNPESRSDILGRIVSGTGVPEGQIIKIISNGKRNETPQLFALKADTGSASDPAHVTFTMVYSADSYKNGRLKSSNILRAHLGREYRAHSTKRLIKGGAKRINRKKVPQRISLSGRGAALDRYAVFPVLHALVKDDGSIHKQLKIVVIDDFNSIADFDSIDQRGVRSPQICFAESAAGDMKVLVSVLKGKKAVNYGMDLTADGTLIPASRNDARKGISGSGLVYFNERLHESGKIIPPLGCQLFASNDGNVYWQAFSFGSNVGGARPLLFAHGGNLESMDCAATTYGYYYELFVLWQKKISESNHQIMGRAVPLIYQ